MSNFKTSYTTVDQQQQIQQQQTVATAPPPYTVYEPSQQQFQQQPVQFQQQPQQQQFQQQQQQFQQPVQYQQQFQQPVQYQQPVQFQQQPQQQFQQPVQYQQPQNITYLPTPAPLPQTNPPLQGGNASYPGTDPSRYTYTNVSTPSPQVQAQHSTTSTTNNVTNINITYPAGYICKRCNNTGIVVATGQPCQDCIDRFSGANAASPGSRSTVVPVVVQQKPSASSIVAPLVAGAVVGRMLRPRRTVVVNTGPRRCIRCGGRGLGCVACRGRRF